MARYFLLLVACGLMSTAAYAHEVHVDAHVDGPIIRGTVVYAGDVPVRAATVQALDPAGQEIGRAETDDEGRFELTPKVRCDHRLLADTGDGHGGSYTIAAAELPQNLPAGAPSAAAHTHTHDADSPAPHSHDADTHTHSHDAEVSDDAPLAVQVQQLRKQLADHDRRTRLRDVIGGVGYILGLAGVAFYFLGTRRQPSQTDDRA